MKALLYSGGLDSVLAWHFAKPDVCVYVRWGAPYERAELEAIEQVAALGGPPVVVIDGPVLQAPAADGHVPHRNLALLISAAAGLPVTPDQLMLGQVLGEASLDKTRRFYRGVSRALRVSEGKRVKVTAPLRRHTKRRWVRRYLQTGGDLALLKATTSCYLAAGCGQCPACFRRWQATVGTPVEAQTLTPPWTWWQRQRAKGVWSAVRRRTALPVTQWPGILFLNLQAWALVRRALR